MTIGRKQYTLYEGGSVRVLTGVNTTITMIQKLAQKLQEIESDHGLEIALLGVESIDYRMLCDLCKVGDFELDEEFRDAMEAYLNDTALAIDLALDGGTCTTQTGDCLTDIADSYGIREWRLLWQLNKEKLGKDWDVIPEKTELVLPDTSKNPLVDWFVQNGWDDYLNPDLGYEYPGKYLSLTFTDEIELPWTEDSGGQDIGDEMQTPLARVPQPGSTNH